MTNPPLMAWQQSPNIKNGHIRIKIAQIYCWLITNDKKIVIVSKNGKDWQLPGGKPDLARNENMAQTVTREVLEETGLDITKKVAGLKQFGYYVVTEPDGQIILQIRTCLRLDVGVNDYKSSPPEDKNQPDKDKVRYVKLASISQLLRLIPWMSESGEFKTLQQNGVL